MGSYAPPMPPREGYAPLSPHPSPAPMTPPARVSGESNHATVRDE